MKLLLTRPTILFVSIHPLDHTSLGLLHSRLICPDEVLIIVHGKT